MKSDYGSNGIEGLSRESPVKPKRAIWLLNSKPRLHAHRASRLNQHHCIVDGVDFAGGAECSGGGEADGVWESCEEPGARDAWVSDGSKSVSGSGVLGWRAESG